MKKITGTHLWTGQRRTSTNERLYRKYDAASGTILDLVSVFKETNGNLKYIFFS
jgi:hypothetical protein